MSDIGNQIDHLQAESDHDLLIMVAIGTREMAAHLKTLNGTVATTLQRVNTIEVSRDACWQNQTECNKRLEEAVNVPVRLTFKQAFCIMLAIAMIAIGGTTSMWSYLT